MFLNDIKQEKQEFTLPSNEGKYRNIFSSAIGGSGGKDRVFYIMEIGSTKYAFPASILFIQYETMGRVVTE